MKKIILLVILASIGYGFYSYIMPTNELWVHGKWKYNDPENNKIDYLVFHPNGVVDLENEKGKYFSCVYVILNQELNMECNIKGKKKEMIFNIFNNNKSLEDKSNDSRYDKVNT